MAKVETGTLIGNNKKWLRLDSHQRVCFFKWSSFIGNFLKSFKPDADSPFGYTKINSFFFFTLNTANINVESLLWKVLQLDLSFLWFYQQIIRQPIYIISLSVCHPNYATKEVGKQKKTRVSYSMSSKL